MPASGMRRTTSDGARVLRSGRRLWLDDDVTPRKKSPVDELLKSVPRAEQNEWNSQPVSKGIYSVTHDADGNLDDPASRESDANYGAVKMFGIVYSRKRKRFQRKENARHECRSDRMCGAYYVRRKKKRLAGSVDCLENDATHPRMLCVTFKGFGRNLHLLATFFSSILNYMRNNSVGLKELAAFLSSQPIAMVFAAVGISFSLEPSCTDGSRCCKIYYTADATLSFSVNFSALPLCFMYIHTTMLLEAERSSLNLVCPKSTCENTEMLNNNKGCLLLDSSGLEMLVTELSSTYESPMSSLDSTGVHRDVVHRKTLPKTTPHTLRKKRTSRISKKAQNSSLYCLKRSNKGRSVSDFFTASSMTQRSFMFANQFQRRPASIPLEVNKKGLKSSQPGLREDTGMTSCLVNLLVRDADKYYKEEGAYITLELFPTNEWFIVVKKNGQIRCCHKAEKSMSPCLSNQVTQNIIWTVADSLKLEFPNEGVWKAFKELYKECLERNMQASTAKFIPVPRVIKVSSYDDEQCDPFSRPKAYISQIGDEVSQALTRRNPNYDMDSEDEEWLNNLNTGSHTQNSTVEHVSDETFELIIDSLEKVAYFMPVDLENGKVPSNLCSDLCSREVLEAVHCYWINKRKKKQSMLIRVFQAYRGLKDPADQNLQRKRRQSKRPAGHSVKAKQQRTAASMRFIASNNVAEEQDVMAKVETADALARQCMDMAVKKRSAAQILMVNANLMMYKAKMSIKIADEAQITRPSELADATDSLNQGPSPPSS
ncbi:unnamed protein product [Rhodiola kirilowii]